MYKLDYPNFIVSNQKEESISIQRVNKKTKNTEYYDHRVPLRIHRRLNFQIFSAVRNLTRLEISYELSARRRNMKYHSLDPDEAQQNLGPDLNPNCLTL